MSWDPGGAARTDETERVAGALLELNRAGIAIAGFSLGQPSLDEVFMALTGRPADTAPAQETDRPRSPEVTT